MTRTVGVGVTGTGRAGWAKCIAENAFENCGTKGAISWDIARMNDLPRIILAHKGNK